MGLLLHSAMPVADNKTKQKSLDLSPIDSRLNSDLHEANIRLFSQGLVGVEVWLGIELFFW